MISRLNHIEKIRLETPKTCAKSAHRCPNGTRPVLGRVEHWKTKGHICQNDIYTRARSPLGPSKENRSAQRSLRAAGRTSCKVRSRTRNSLRSSGEAPRIAYATEAHRDDDARRVDVHRRHVAIWWLLRDHHGLQHRRQAWTGAPESCKSAESRAHQRGAI